MRFGLAIASLVIAGVLLLLGLGQRTVFAPPDEIAYPAEIAQGAEYAVIPADRFDAVAGQANLVLSGEETFAAIGSAADVTAWVAPFAHEELSVDPKSKRLSGKIVAAEPGEMSAKDLEAVDPQGSDLWTKEADGTARMPMALAADQAVLLSIGAGGGASIVWVQDSRTPLAGPLLAAGGVFAVLGLVLYLLAIDHNRRGLGPRRGRSGPLSGLRRHRAKDSARGAASRDAAAKRLAVPSLGLVAVLALSGCSSSYWPDLSAAPSQAPATSEARDQGQEQNQDQSQDQPQDQADEAPAGNVAPVPIAQAQIDRIINDVARVAGEGDDAHDPKLLEGRFDGDALAQRVAHYKIVKKVPGYEVVLPRITAEQLGYELVQSTDEWPRTVFATVASRAPESPKDAKAKDAAAKKADAAAGPVASPSLAMVLTQASPFENYRVTRLFALRGGITMPSAAPVQDGTALLSDDLKTLVLQPGQVGPGYAKVLTEGASAKQAALFDLSEDQIIAKSGAAWVRAAKKSAKKDGFDVKYSVKAAQTGTPILSLSTGVGGALVSTTVLESRIETQSGKYQPKAVGAVTALSGLKGAQKRIVSKVAHQLLFFVPSDTSDEKIQLLGYTTELVGASK